MEQVKEIINITRLAEINEAEAWKVAYIEEVSKLEKTIQRFSELTYNLYVNQVQSEELGLMEGSLHVTLSDPRLLQTLKKWQNQLDEEVWQRRLGLMVQQIEEKLVDSDPRIGMVLNELQGALMTKEFHVDGHVFNVASINASRMEMSDRDLRRKLHEAVSQYGNDVNESFRELIKTRNTVAQEYGYANYYDFKFQSKGLNFEQYKEECFTILENAKAVTEKWEKAIKEKFGWDSIYSSDWLYIASNFSQVDPEKFNSAKITEALGEASKKFGVYLEQLPIDVKVAPLPFGGACLKITKDDIRMVINERNGHSVFFTAFHEFGHALYEAFSSNQHFEFFEFKSIIAHESMAELFATISGQEKWLRDFWNLEKEDAQKIIEAQHLFQLILMKVYFYFSLVEQAIYENPESNFQEIANQLYQEVFGTEDIGYHPAAELLYTSNPVYVQDYIYADGVRDMLLHALKIEGMYGENEAFEVVKKEFLEPSERFTWKEKVKSICGEDFTFAYYGKYLATGVKE